jgi:hypothetical protein
VRYAEAVFTKLIMDLNLSSNPLKYGNAKDVDIFYKTGHLILHAIFAPI